MIILYFHQHFSTPQGASGTRSYEMARRLILRGHKVIMVCGSGSISNKKAEKDKIKGMRRYNVDGIDIIELDIPYSNYFGFVKRTYVFIKYAIHSIFIAMTLKYDVVFATSTPLTAGIPGICATILRNKPFVFEVRDLWPELPKAMGIINNVFIIQLMSMLEWLSYHTAKSCIGLSPGIVQGIMKRGIKKENIFMIPNACDLEIFNNKSKKTKRPEGVTDDDLLAIFTGAHGIANGLDAVLDTALILKQRGNKKIKFLFIGDGKEKSKLIEKSQKNTLENCIFIEPVSKIILAEYLRGADIGLMILANIPAFYYGTSPNKFFDYIATGLPVINNYPGWLAKMISENNCGIAIEPNNPEIFADALEKIEKNRDVIKIMGKNARILAEKDFDRTILADQFVNIIEKIATN